MARSVGALVFIALSLAASARASTQRDALIRPGVGIGKVKLGMTLAQVRSAWGRPQAQTIETQERGGRRIELQYHFAAYTVTLTGLPQRERVVSIATTLVREKLANGLGVGSRETRLQRALRGRLRCDRLDVFNQPRNPYPMIQTNRRECRLGEAGLPQTVFASRMRVHSWLPEDWSKTAYVYEVVIRAPGAA
jgi:hypothetical protein